MENLETYTHHNFVTLVYNGLTFNQRHVCVCTGIIQIGSQSAAAGGLEHQTFCDHSLLRKVQHLRAN